VVLERGHLVEDSAPDVSLARLRREYQRQIDANLEAEAAERTDQAARIAGVWLNGTQAPSRLAGPQVKIEPGADLRLRCRVEFPTAVPGWFLHFKIESMLGVTHCEISSRDSLRLTMPEQEVVDVELALPNLMLGDGEYSIAVMVFDANAVLLDLQSRGATFAVKSAGHSYGAVYCDASLSFNSP
jgi:hypothetical protein